jgi:hypothetical protein
MDPLTNLNPPAIYGEAVAGESSLRKEALSLVNGIQERTFDLAELLYKVRQGNLPQTWGFQSIGDYGSKELGLKPRKVYYLIRIVEVCTAVGLKRADYEQAGVSKLREITRLDPEGSYFNPETKESELLAEHIVRLIVDADEMTTDQVEQEVLRLTGQVGENRPVTRTMVYPQIVWENTIKPAQELARKRLGSAKRDAEGTAVEYSEGAVEEMIHAEFLADPNNYPEDNTEIPTEDANSI